MSELPKELLQAAWEQVAQQAEKLAADMRSMNGFVVPTWVKPSGLNEETQRIALKLRVERDEAALAAELEKRK